MMGMQAPESLGKSVTLLSPASYLWLMYRDVFSIGSLRTVLSLPHEPSAGSPVTTLEVKQRIDDLKSALSLRQYVLREHELPTETRRSFEEHVIRLNQEIHLAHYRLMLDEFTS